MRRNFTLYFVIGLALIVLATFVVFTLVARDSVAQRRHLVAHNLAKFGKTLAAESTPPADAVAFLRAKLDPMVLVHPSWPEQPGYMLVEGVRLTGADADPPDTIWIYENVPPQKLKVGRHILLASGNVEIDDPRFQQRLAAQEEGWKKAGRTWSIRPLGPP